METVLTEIEQVLSPSYIRDKIEVHQRNCGGYTYTYQDVHGEVNSIVYPLYPGIKLIHKKVKRGCFLTNWREKSEQGFVIEHCWKGHMQYQKEDVIIHPIQGDFFIYKKDRTPYMQYYPTKDFCSMAISFDFDELDDDFLGYLHTASIDFSSLTHKYQLDEGFYHIIEDRSIVVRIFEDLHSALYSEKILFCKLKLFEILMVLDSYDIDKNALHKPKITRTQECAVKSARQYLLTHPYERITITELAEKVAISPSFLKSGFKEIFGTTPKQFDISNKMQIAAKLIRETDDSISTIAHRLSYINVSKFAAVFLSVHGLSPSDYRKCHQIK